MCGLLLSSSSSRCVVFPSVVQLFVVQWMSVSNQRNLVHKEHNATCTIRRETCEGNAFNVHGSGWVDVCCPARRCCPSKRRRYKWCQRNLFIVLSSARVWLRVKIQRSPYTSRHAKILKVRELHWHFLRDHSCAHAAAAAGGNVGNTQDHAALPPQA